MNEQYNGKKSSTGKYFLWAWIIALGVFLLFLVIMIVNEAALPDDVSKEQSRTSAIRNSMIEPASVLPPEQGYVLDNLPKFGSLENPELKFTPDDTYILLGAGLQGFYQSPSAQSAWSLNLPEYTLAVQLVQRDIFPVMVNSDVRVEWELDSASNQPAKAEVPAEARKGVFVYNEDSQAFEAIIPATALETEGAYNPYPIFIIKAYDADNVQIAETGLNLGVAPDFGCSYCHADPQYGVLQAHDTHQGTNLEKQARKGEKVQCVSCHSGVAAKDGNLVSAGPALGVSASVHAWHAPYLADSGEEACLSCHIGLGKAADEGPEVWPRRMFMRDVHLQRGLSCVACHGTLEDHALALLLAEKQAGQSMAAAAIERIQPRAVASVDEINARMPWVQEPDCASCHDFQTKPNFETASAFNKWTDHVGDDAALFSVRTDGTGQIRCISCHGAPHAVYPSRNAIGSERDNLQPVQYQQDPRPLGGEGNCAVCHTMPMEFPPHHDLVERSSTLLTVPEGAVLFMPQVRFSHDAHDSVDCMTCHHKGHEDGQPVGCTAAGCHDLVKADPANQAEDYRYFRNAFHGLIRSCNACHLERQEKSLPGGPTNCQGCHRAPSKMWASPEE